jgi:predicted helicase
MARTPQSIDRTFLKKAVDQYFAELAEYQKVANYELGLRAAFQHLLACVAKHIGWSLAPEMTLSKIRPDGVVLDEFRIRRGYWEAKGPATNLEKEIAKKIEHKYPLTNTIFEDSKTAILYQSKKRVPVVFKLQVHNDVIDLLNCFFTYVEPDIEHFEQAVDEFRERIPEHAQALLDLINEEHRRNQKFAVAFGSFAKLCRDSIDPQMDDVAINEMLVQHLLTERLFRTVFNNPDFTRRNVIAAEIEKVIDVLAIRSFNRSEFLKILDRFYVAIEQAARGIESWSERQEFLNTVYECFFQGFSVKKADTHGIVYTPQEIVDFMVESVDVVLKQAFGKSIETPGVKILDPATGTGNFIVNIIRRVSSRFLKEKYAHDLFCNEIMLLPYYIASLNIEHEYYAQMKQYAPFDGICFADTLELAEGRQLSLFVEENTERVKREKEADIMVVIGNPPYNAKQMNENDNNKNRRYKTVEERIRETYAKDSEASNKNALSDVYVQFFRWAADRLNARDGVVCLVTNNSFVDQIAFDGMRMHLGKDFNQIYHLDLHGNIRKNPRLSGTIHNVFGVQIGIGITIAIRNTKDPECFLKYYRVPENWRKIEKLTFLQEKVSIANIDWLTLQPDKKFTWITNGLQTEFGTFLPIGSRNAKATRPLADGSGDIEAIFKTYSPGAQTNRDNWMYDFDSHKLTIKASAMIETYNAELSRWIRAGIPKNIDNFVLNDETKIKWCSRLKEYFVRKVEARFRENAIRHSLYRPFTRQFLYFDNIMIHRPGMFSKVFPTLKSESENRVICVPSVGNRKEFGCLATNMIPRQDLAFETSQCFPYYTYAEDGSNRRENITDWALKQFRAKYGEQVSKWDIFHYVYGVLHHPQYRELYRENLKRAMPHIPLVLHEEAFRACVRVGKQLMEMHVQYESEEEYPLREVYKREVPYEQSLLVEKMKLSPDKATLIYSKGLTLKDIPQACFSYSLGNRSALEWVIDQYQISTDKRSGIVSDPNRWDDSEYIVRLVKRVVMVSVKTVELVRELSEVVGVEEWVGGVEGAN